MTVIQKVFDGLGTESIAQRKIMKGSGNDNTDADVIWFNICNKRKII